MRKLFLIIFALQIMAFVSCLKNANIEEENKANVRNWFEEGWNKHRLEVYDKYFAPEFVSATGQNYHEYKQFIATVLSAFPDVHYTIDVLMAEGDKVANRWTVSGTHRGEFMGIPATGKQITITGINISRHKNGKYVEDWGNYDALGLLQQLNADAAPR